MKGLLTILVFISLGLHAQEHVLEECNGYVSFGSTLPISEDKMNMIEELTEAMKSITSPPGTYDKKVEFFQSVIPDILGAFSSVEEERKLMLSILQKDNPTEAELAALEDLKIKYNAVSNEDLKDRINIVPLDLALVQSAIETGWGQSNAAANCNNMVGIQAHGGLTICDTPSKKIASFPNREQSFSAYLLALNRNDKYKDFRAKRAQLFKNKRAFTGIELAPLLTSYSQRPVYYVNEVRTFIRNHGLDKIMASALEISDQCDFPTPAE